MNNLISVIIPTYHNRGGLKPAIDSVISQKNVDVEIIVVDDNDPNTEWRRTTENLMKNYNGISNLIYIQHQANSNGAAARNTGIKASHGDYIAFLDDDDIFLPDKLNRQLNFLHDHPQYNAVYGQMLRSGKIVAENLPEGNLSKDILLLKSHLQTSTLLFRAHSIKQIGGFDEKFYRHQDYEMLLKYFHAGNKIGAVQFPVSEFGRNAGENIPIGERLENIKRMFFNSFNTYIIDFDKITPGFKNAVYARHYSGVFLSHIKNGYYLKGIKHLVKYTCLSPKNFWQPVIRSAVKHITGNY